MINIFTIATDIYKVYIPILKKSLSNFTPKNEQIRFILISDKMCCNCDIYYHICNLPYPFNTYHKLDYIIDCINENHINKSDYFIYVDADTYFRKMPDDFWNITFKELINTHKLCFANSPWKYTAIPKIENNFTEFHCQEVYVKNLNTKTNWIQASFFMGPIYAIYGEFYNKWNEIITNCTKNHRQYPVIPYIYDQSVINKIISLNYSKYIIDDFIFNAYDIDVIHNNEYITNDLKSYNLITANNSYSLNNYEKIFLIQKFNQELKTKRL